MTKTRKLAKARYAIYLKKTAEFDRTMRDAAARKDWNAVGLNAVHTVISAADALTTFYLGERSTGDSHFDVIDLLRQLPLEEAKEKAQQAFSVINEKNVIEYEDVDFDEKSAGKIEKQARRFHEWARAKLRG
ncbi:MAG: hypothetical protein WDA16_01120 [Candidatus Thermoplasmatota archaeon]